MQRPFVSVASARPAGAQEPELTIVTYNILADKYATSGFHSYASAELLAWGSRWPRILQEIQKYDADVLCLQEVEEPVFRSQLLPALPGYAGLFYGSAVGPRDTVQGPVEGVALLTKRSRVEVLDSQTVRFADHIPSGWPDGACRSELNVRQDGAVLALCRDAVLGWQFVAAVTHLHWDPRWPDVKLCQAAILTQRLAAFVDSHKPSAHGEPLPMLLAGDFNSLWRKITSDAFDEVPQGTAIHSGVYQLLATGALTRRHHDHPWPRSRWRGKEEADWMQVDFKSAMAPLLSAYYRDNCEPPLTTKTATFAGALDYIWLGWGWAVTQLLELPYKAETGADASQLTEYPAMPNDTFPSDHLAMGARLIAPCDLVYDNCAIDNLPCIRH